MNEIVEKLLEIFKTRLGIKSYKDAIDIVNRLAKGYGKNANVLSNGGWIPISRGIPTIDGKYFVTEKIRYRELDERYYITQTHVETGTGNVRFYDEYHNDVTDNVIAWMPYPEPYKEGEE